MNGCDRARGFSNRDAQIEQEHAPLLNTVIFNYRMSPLAVITVSSALALFDSSNQILSPVSSSELRNSPTPRFSHVDSEFSEFLLHDVHTGDRNFLEEADSKRRILDPDCSIQNQSVSAMLLGLFFLSHRSELRW